MAECDYPSFRHRFFSASTWLPVDLNAVLQDKAQVERGAVLHEQASWEDAPDMAEPRAASSDGAGTLVQFKPLRALDLRSLGKQDTEAGDEAARRDKLASFFKECSKVLDGLYIGSEYVAKSFETLSKNGITHVINCVGALYPEYFAKEGLQYKTLYLRGAESTVQSPSAGRVSGRKRYELRSRSSVFSALRPLCACRPAQLHFAVA